MMDLGASLAASDVRDGLRAFSRVTLSIAGHSFPASMSLLQDDEIILSRLAT